MKRKLYLSLIACFSFAFAWSQTRQVTGRVISDSTKQPLGGVSVTIKGTNTATATDNNGHYSIAIPNRNNIVLVFTSVGYTRQEVNVGSKTNVDITLASSSNALDVVVIGYQTVRRKDLLASVSSVSSKDLKDIPINSAAEALNGRLAGVTVTSSEGSPDATINVRVRGGMSITGDNSPLYVIDGVEVDNALSIISPQDIETIDVLKDAAATAIYGARGANGVIIITTKRGRAGKTRITYNGFIGIQKVAKTLDVLSPYDYVFYQSERTRGSSTDSTNFTNYFGHTWDTLNVYKNIAPVNWQDELFGRTGIMTTHNISATGGNKKFVYNLGYTFNDNKAIVLNSYYQRHIFTLKTDYNITKNLKIGINGIYTNQDVYGAGVSSDQGTSYNRLRNAVKYRPYLSPGQDIASPDALADPNVGNGLFLTNPIQLANMEFRHKSTDNYNFSANLNYNITKHLTFRSVFGYNQNNFVDLQFEDSLTPVAIIQGGRKPVAVLDTSKLTTINNSNVFTYSIQGFKNKHDFSILVGEETYDYRTTVTIDQYKNYPLNIAPNDAFHYTSLATSFTGYPQLAKTRATILSFFSRINYAYKDKYLLSVNVREDGSSKFAANQRWGTFPSGSLAWRVSREKFMENVSFINDLKFRFGYGTIGNNRISDYQYLPFFSGNGTYYYGINGQPVIAYYPSALPNPNLTWESMVNRNFGMDVSLWKSRISLSVDYYINDSKNLLLYVPIASTYGYTTQYQNVGKTENKGYEVQLNATIMRKNNFTWTANFNISHNDNRIVALGTNQSYFYPPASWGVSGQPTDYIAKVGAPVSSIYGLVTDGFYKVSDFNYNTATGVYTLKPGIVNDASIIGTVMPGSIKFKDLNGDGLVDLDNDRTIIGNPNPKFFGGLNQQFTYKNWDASVFVNFTYGNDVYNANKIEFTNGYTANANLLSIMGNRWKVVTPDGQTAEWVNSSGQVVGIPPDQLAALNANATIWQPLKSAGAFYPSSWAIEDGSFIRINNVTIGYTLPVQKLTRLKITRLRFYVTGNNLAILTKYSGYDPEVNVRANNPLTQGLDYSAYPKSRTFLFGVNASF